MELVHCEMAPATRCSSTQHAALLGREPVRRSRNLLICCYNKATNDPYKAHHHPGYTPLAKVPDEAVLAAGARLADAGARWFLEEGKDETTEARRARVERARDGRRPSPPPPTGSSEPGPSALPTLSFLSPRA
jgi:hypothetical protein